MAIVEKVLIEGKTAELAATTQYTATGVKARITAFVAQNIDTVTREITVYLNDGDGGISLLTRRLGAGESIRLSEVEGQALEDGDSIVTSTDAASAINIRCSGFEVTT